MWICAYVLYLHNRMINLCVLWFFSKREDNNGLTGKGLAELLIYIDHGDIKGRDLQLLGVIQV